MLDACDYALRKLQQTDFPSLVEENRRLHQLMVDGVDVDITREDGSIGTDKAKLIDFENPANNDWVGGQSVHRYRRREKTGDPTWLCS